MTSYIKPVPTISPTKKTPPAVWVPPGPSTQITSGVCYDTEIGSTYEDTKMWMFPMSMRFLKESGYIPTGSTQDNWLYYKVDLIAGVNTPEILDYCHVETNYDDWSASKSDYNIGDDVKYQGYDYRCLVNLNGIVNRPPPNYPLWWAELTGGTSQVYMPKGSFIVECQDYNQWSLISSGGTTIQQCNIHYPGLIWHYTRNVVYYSISTPAVNTEYVLNKLPFYVYRQEKCGKYSKWQLFWLSPHGGYDTFTFDRKIDVDYSINRTSYKQRTPKDYTPYFGGEQSFNINIDEEITLRTNTITQKESQLLIQLVQSPKVYVLKEYQYDPNDPSNVYKYAVPYMVTSSEVKYQNRDNDKENCFYEIKIRPSSQKSVQNY